MPIDKPKIVSSYSMHYHEVMRCALAQPGTRWLLESGPEAVTKHERRKWRAFVKSAKVSARYGAALKRLEVKTSLDGRDLSVYSQLLQDDQAVIQKALDEHEKIIRSSSKNA